MATGSAPDGALGKLTERESEILRKAGERVFALSKRLAEREREADQLRSEVQGARELLAESREVRQVLTEQIQSLQTSLDREYEERAELRRLLASLHLQMQELLPIVSGLNRPEMPALADATPVSAEAPIRREAQPNSLARRLFTAAGAITGNTRSASKRRH